MRKVAAWVGLVVLVVATIVGALFLRSLSRQNVAQDDERPLILATVPHIASWVKNLVGDSARIEIIASGGIEVHNFAITPQTVALSESASIIVANGADLEPWLDTLAASNTPVIETAGELDLRGNDPHTWLDPAKARKQVQVAAAGIIKVLPELSETIAINLALYDAALAALDDEILRNLDGLPRKELISFHESFDYFAESYGLNVVASLVRTPGDETTLQEIENIKNLVSQYGLTSIYVEPGPTPDLAQTLASDLGISLRILDPLETISGAATSYIDGMRGNLAVLLAGQQ